MWRSASAVDVLNIKRHRNGHLRFHHKNKLTIGIRMYFGVVIIIDIKYVLIRCA